MQIYEPISEIRIIYGKKEIAFTGITQSSFCQMELLLAIGVHQNVSGGIKQYRAKPQLGTSGKKSEVVAKTLISSLKLRRGGTAGKAVAPLELNRITQLLGYKGIALQSKRASTPPSHRSPISLSRWPPPIRSLSGVNVLYDFGEREDLKWQGYGVICG